MRKILFSLIGLLLCVAGTMAQNVTKVACVGNSITYGMGIADRDNDSYPAQLQKMLGNGYEVGNFGKSGATLLNLGHRPYTREPEFRAALDFAADIVVIHLGINDTDPRNWPNYRDLFIPDYRALIDSFRAVKPDCRVLVARLTPIPDRHRRFESGTRDWRGQIQEAIETIAATADNVQLIDFSEPLYHYPFLFPDALHPNEEGAGILARTVYEGITGDFGGLAMPDIYTDNMVLQYGRPLPISGKADAGEEVTVTLGKQKQRTTAAANGTWSVTLDPIEAGGPYTLEISTSKRHLVYNNVLGGEVWLCSGQSNMEFRLRSCTTGQTDIPLAEDNELRLFDMKVRWPTNELEWDSTVLDSVNHLDYYLPTTWQACTPPTAAEFSAIAYYFGKRLRDSLQVPVGLICNAVGGSPAESWVSREALEYEFPAILHSWRQSDFGQHWARGRATLNVKQADNDLQRHPYEPCYLYEAGILPLASYTIRGVVWYQGESNAHNPEAHDRLFPLLVNSWRDTFADPELPFYFVQLSGMNRPAWPWFRDRQRRLMEEIPHTGMAVCSDKGDSLDVHPRQKREVGERLAAWALNQTYGRADVVPSGPLYKSVRFEKGEAVVSFDYGEGMRAADGEPLRTFEVAGADGIYHSAQATVEGNTVRVWSEEVKTPVAVRYAWQPFTRANLVNGAGLPASTFLSLEKE